MPPNPQGRATPVVAALGVAQTVAWASSYYLPAVLATPMAAGLGLSPVWIFAGFTLAMTVSAAIGPWAGERIDTLGGRAFLPLTNVVFAIGLTGLSMSTGQITMMSSWFIIGIGMGTGLYDAAFAALARHYGQAARSPITGVTLIAGFASTVGWPLSGAAEAFVGWRGTCLMWAGLHLLIALPLNLSLPSVPGPPNPERHSSEQDKPREKAPIGTIMLLSFVFTATWFTSTAMAAHLPRLLEASGASTATAIAAGALIGPAQVAARLLEFGFLKKFHPLVSALIAALLHPVGAVVLFAVGGAGAFAFAILHGAGNGILTIAKGTLPLALFGHRGYGRLQGWLSAPARIAQAGAPLIFEAAMDRWGAGALWITSSVSVLAFLSLLALPRSARR